ncbi:transposase [Hyphomonas sp. WL0036]|uniref:REP-associated tyrosine transposase n=1 Tax=Hyphomonas sediminis TaxID=2866160 RepID=UPI001C82422D|nr:transposase [Hyphomonas sediminis]MBY9066510.1 transposase [Hyphomonas sediminis]
MSNYRRLFVPGGTYFFTLNLRDRRSDLLVRHIGALRESWGEVVRVRPFETLAAVVLPDHMHVVMALPEGDADYPARLRLLKSGFTRRLPAAEKAEGRKGERNVWQRRYWEHAIRDEADLDAHVNYVHFNPVKHGHVAEMDDWPYSTWPRRKAELGFM